jgi:hypothetical protein
MIFALKKMIGDPQLFNSEAKKAWKNAIQLMFIQFGEGLLHEEKEQNKLESMNGLNRKTNLL